MSAISDATQVSPLKTLKTLRREIFVVRKPRDWSKVIDRLNRSRSGELRVKMGSPGSAQERRCRLLAQWANLEAETIGATLVLRLPR